jgi:hypothetical protein
MSFVVSSCDGVSVDEPRQEPLAEEPHEGLCVLVTFKFRKLHRGAIKTLPAEKQVSSRFGRSPASH